MQCKVCDTELPSTNSICPFCKSSQDCKIVFKVDYIMAYDFANHSPCLVALSTERLVLYAIRKQVPALLFFSEELSNIKELKMPEADKHEPNYFFIQSFLTVVTEDERIHKIQFTNSHARIYFKKKLVKKLPNLPINTGYEGDF